VHPRKLYAAISGHPWVEALSKPILAVVIIASIGMATNQLIASYSIGSSVSTMSFVAATCLAVAYRVVNPYGWTLVLSGLGYKTQTHQSVRIWLLAESRRWLPGGVWSYASRAVQAGKLGVPIAVASASMMVELLITMAAAVTVSVLGLALYYQKFSVAMHQLIVEKLGGTSLPLIAWATLAAILIAVLAFVARRKLASKVRGLVERFAGLQGVRLNHSKLFAALGYMCVMAILNGCVNLMLLPLVDDASTVPALVMVAATASAWIVGLLAFFSPGGLLIREAALAALLLPWISYEAGITLAVLSRIAQLLAEVVCMAPVFWFDQRVETAAATAA